MPRRLPGLAVPALFVLAILPLAATHALAAPATRILKQAYIPCWHKVPPGWMRTNWCPPKVTVPKPKTK